MKIVIGILIWTISIAATAALTFFVTDNYNRRKQAEEMFSQFRQFTEIREDLKRIRSSAISMDNDLATIRDGINTDLAERFEKFDECAVMDPEIFALLKKSLAKIEKRGDFKNAKALRENLESSHHAYQQTADLILAAKRDLDQSLSAVLGVYGKRLRLLKRFARDNAKKYKTMLTEVRELLKVPVELDFDPQKDITYVKKRIRETESELAKITELEKTFQTLSENEIP